MSEQGLHFYCIFLIAEGQYRKKFRLFETIYTLFIERSNVYASFQVNLRQRNAINRDRTEDLYTVSGLSSLSNFTVDKITIEYY